MTGGRPRLPIGAHGDITTRRSASGGFTAETRVRDGDGKVRRATASGPTASAAKAELRERLVERARTTHGSASPSELGPRSTFRELAEQWLEDIRLSPDLAGGTKDVYRRELRSLVMPTFGELLVSEVTTGRIDRFIKQQAAVSYAHARHSRVVLNLVFNFALRQDVVARNPVAGTARLKRPNVTPKALTVDQIEALRLAARTWRTQSGLSGPRPDGQVRDLIEVMLGTGARIGEALALRKCDVDATASPLTVSVNGTLVALSGQPVSRQSHPKTEKSRRVIAVPVWTAEVLLGLLARIADRPDEHLLFFTRNGTPLAPVNARRTLRRFIAEAGLEGHQITPHAFRRTTATALDRGADVETAADHLGNSSEIARRHYVEPAVVDVNPAPAEILSRLAPRSWSERTRGSVEGREIARNLGRTSSADAIEGDSPSIARSEEGPPARSRG